MLRKKSAACSSSSSRIPINIGGGLESTKLKWKGSARYWFPCFQLLARKYLLASIPSVASRSRSKEDRTSKA